MRLVRMSAFICAVGDDDLEDLKQDLERELCWSPCQQSQVDIRTVASILSVQRQFACVSPDPFEVAERIASRVAAPFGIESKRVGPIMVHGVASPTEARYCLSAAEPGVPILAEEFSFGRTELRDTKIERGSPAQRLEQRVVGSNGIATGSSRAETPDCCRVSLHLSLDVDDIGVVVGVQAAANWRHRQIMPGRSWKRDGSGRPQRSAAEARPLDGRSPGFAGRTGKGQQAMTNAGAKRVWG